MNQRPPPAKATSSQSSSPSSSAASAPTSFYMGETGWGILYLCFCWTFIPHLVSFVECFLLPGRVRRYNDALAYQIASPHPSRLSRRHCDQRQHVPRLETRSSAKIEVSPGKLRYCPALTDRLLPAHTGLTAYSNSTTEASPSAAPSPPLRHDLHASHLGVPQPQHHMRRLASADLQGLPRPRPPHGPQSP